MRAGHRMLPLATCVEIDRVTEEGEGLPGEIGVKISLVQDRS